MKTFMGYALVAVAIPLGLVIAVGSVVSCHDRTEKHEMPALKSVEPPMHPVIKDGVVVGHATADDVLPPMSSTWTGAVSGNFYAPVTMWFGNDSNGNTLDAHGTKCHLEEMYSKINRDQIVDCEEFSIFIYDAKDRHAPKGVNR